MRKNRQKLFWVILCFFLASANTALALEVKYPIIKGQTLTSDTPLPEFALYLFNAGMFIGFFAVFGSMVAAGVMYLFSGAYPTAELRGRAKDRLSGAISGLLILITLFLIVTTINPQLSWFNSRPLPPSPAPPAEKPPAGVYFNKQSSCQDDTAALYTSSVPDLGTDLTNRISSVELAGSDVFYVSVLYNLPNYTGACQYLDPNDHCTEVAQFADSASIYTYDFSPNGDGVYFFRKSCLNNSSSVQNTSELILQCQQNGGGWYKVKNDEINGIFESRLDDLRFYDVPQAEKECLKYDVNGDCLRTARTAPTLGGENISSIIIHGNYFILLTYAKPGQQCSDMEFDMCQGFPTSEDVNKMGPRQIKWQDIRNNSEGVVPNCITIVPVTQK